jgi:uridine kinase
MAPLVVGVAGGSGSGKTTLVGRLVQALGTAETTVLAHDRYYRDHSTLSPTERATFNYDHPNALETRLLIANLRALRSGAPADVPVYDFRRHVRKPSWETVSPQTTIVVEGILVLADPALRALMDIKVFMDVDDDTRFSRRLERDMRERGRSQASVIHQYTASVRPMYLQFVEPTRRYADVVIGEGGYNDVGLGELLTRIRALVEGPGPNVTPDRARRPPE